MVRRSPSVLGTSKRWEVAPSVPARGSRSTTRAWDTPAGRSNSRASDLQPATSLSRRRTSTCSWDSKVRPLSRWVTATPSSRRAARVPSNERGRASNSTATSTRVSPFGRASKANARALRGDPGRDRDGVQGRRHHRRRLARRRGVRPRPFPRRGAQRITLARAHGHARPRNLDAQLAPGGGRLVGPGMEPDEVVRARLAGDARRRPPRSLVFRKEVPPVSSASACGSARLQDAGLETRPAEVRRVGRSGVGRAVLSGLGLQPTGVDEVHRRVCRPRRRRYVAGRGARVLEEAAREEKDGLPPPAEREGVEGPPQGRQQDLRALPPVSVHRRRRRAHPRRARRLLPSLDDHAGPGRGPALDDAVQRRGVLAVADREGLVVGHVVEGQRGIGRFSLKASRDGEHVRTSLGHGRGPPRVAAGGGEGDRIAVAQRGGHEARDRVARVLRFAQAQPLVVHDHRHHRSRVRCAGRGGRFGAPRGRRFDEDVVVAPEALEADDLLGHPVFLHYEVLPGEVLHRPALRVHHDHVDGDQLDLRRELGAGHLGQHEGGDGQEPRHACTPGASWPVRSTYST